MPINAGIHYQKAEDEYNNAIVVRQDDILPGETKILKIEPGKVMLKKDKQEM